MKKINAGIVTSEEVQKKQNQNLCFNSATVPTRRMPAFFECKRANADVLPRRIIRGPFMKECGYEGIGCI
jgi:hypothetical protein